MTDTPRWLRDKIRSAMTAEHGTQVLLTSSAPAPLPVAPDLWLTAAERRTTTALWQRWVPEVEQQVARATSTPEAAAKLRHHYQEAHLRAAVQLLREPNKVRKDYIEKHRMDSPFWTPEQRGAAVAKHMAQRELKLRVWSKLKGNQKEEGDTLCP